MIDCKLRGLRPLLVSLVFLTSFGCLAGTRCWAASQTILPLKVIGNHILTSDNKPIVLRGVDAASMEFTSDGEGHILTTVMTAIKVWHANIIRLPLSQDRWFGKGTEQKNGPKAYRNLVSQIVKTCQDNGCYIILDLHWSDENQWGKAIGQHLMPDDNSVAFWKDFARVYRNNPAVVFDLYNEPHDVTWDVWLKGGPVTESNRFTQQSASYNAVGMQTMLDTIRSTGAKNVVVAGGLDWAYDMSGFLKGYQLSDPKGNGVIYANHFYPIKGDTVDQWIAKMKAATSVVPVIVSEFGAQSYRRRPGGFGPPPSSTDPATWVSGVLNACDQNGWSWTAWDMHPSAGPVLISDWNYTPTPSFGALVLAQLAVPPAYVMPGP